MLHAIALLFFSAVFIGAVSVIAYMLLGQAGQIRRALAYRAPGQGDDAFAARYRIAVEPALRVTTTPSPVAASAVRVNSLRSDAPSSGAVRGRVPPFAIAA